MSPFDILILARPQKPRPLGSRHLYLIKIHHQIRYNNMQSTQNTNAPSSLRPARQRCPSQDTWTRDLTASAAYQEPEIDLDVPTEYPNSLPSSPPDSPVPSIRTNSLMPHRTFRQSGRIQKRRARSSSASSGNDNLSHHDKRTRTHTSGPRIAGLVESIGAHMLRVKTSAGSIYDKRHSGEYDLNRPSSIYSTKVMKLVLGHHELDIVEPQPRDQSGKSASLSRGQGMSHQQSMRGPHGSERAFTQRTISWGAGLEGGL
jgi:hypothetical protein